MYGGYEYILNQIKTFREKKNFLLRVSEIKKKIIFLLLLF